MFYYKLMPITKNIDTYFTYLSKNPLTRGQRVFIDLRGKHITAVVFDEDKDINAKIKYKEIDFILDEYPVLDEKHFEEIEEISKKFIIPKSDVFSAYMPSSSSDINKIKIIPMSQISGFEKPIFMNEFYRMFPDKKTATKRLNEMIKNNLIKLEHYKSDFRRNETVYFYRLKKNISEIMNTKISSSGIKIVNYINIKGICTINELYENNILIKGSSALNTLIKNGIAEEIKGDEILKKAEKYELSAAQKNIFEEITKSEKLIHMIYGVTGSGKTEIFFEIIDKCLKEKGKAMLMVPEISLTPQTITRIKKRFPDKKIIMYHSSLTASEKTKNWYRAAEGDYDIIVGTRSSVFIPAENLKLIIMDEEHDSSYYQTENMSYDSRDVAFIRSAKENIKVILASATPRISDISNDKIIIHRLNERYNIEMPDIEILDMKNEKKINWLFTVKTIKEIDAVLKKNKKVIIFTPARGYSNYIICTDCGHIIKCDNCDVSMTYYREEYKLKCHYCGNEKNAPDKCPVCSGINLQTRGYGTEKVYSDIQKLFPSETIVRMDRSVISSYSDLSKTYEFINNEGKMIIIGTKMITKGLDIKDLELVVIMDSDRFTDFPDYNATENAGALIMQVAGRAGRKEKGKVIIQTFKKESGFYGAVSQHNYDSIINAELEERKIFNYPPFSDLLLVIISDTDENKAKNISDEIYREIIKMGYEGELYGPVKPMIYKLKNKYRYQIIIKTKKTYENLKNIFDKYRNNLYVYLNPPSTML